MVFAFAVVLSMIFISAPLAGYLIIDSNMTLSRKLLVAAALGYVVIAIPFLVLAVAHFE
jgi:hypothetical protein